MTDPADTNHGLHVALVACHPARTGGMEKFCRFLVRNLLDAGWHVTVALSGEDIYTDLAGPADDPHGVHPRTCVGPASSRSVFRILGCPLDVQRVDWLDPTFAGDRSYSLNTIRERRRWFRAVRPDVAVFVQSSNTPLRASIVGAALAGVPIVTTHRTMPWPVEDAPASRHFFGLLPGLHLHRRKVVLKTWLTAALARAVVCNSRAVATGYETLYAYPHRKTIVIPNATELPTTTYDEPASTRTASASESAACQSPERKRGVRSRSDRIRTASASESVSLSSCTVGYVGRISREKRLDLLIHALAKMKTSRKAQLLLFGEGPERANLMQLAHRLGLFAQITWAGPTQDVWSAYSQCDIVALCSPRESSSNMILEAMAAGKATVVTQVGGLPELVDSGQAGICIPPLDVDALTAALDYLADRADVRRQMGQRARARAAKLHDPRRIGDAWRNVLLAAAGVRVKAGRDRDDAEGVPAFLLIGATDGLPARQY